MTNAVANKYNNRVMYNASDARNAIEELEVEKSRLKAKLEENNTLLKEYNKILSILNNEISDYDGFTYNKIVNAEKGLEKKYKGNEKANDLKNILNQHKNRVGNVKKMIQNLRDRIIDRTSEIRRIINNTESQINEVENTSAKVYNQLSNYSEV